MVVADDWSGLLDRPLWAPVDDAGLLAWLDDEDPLADAVLSAWATPVPLAIAAPRPSVTAPAPSQA
ncbi:hypothetical protein [Mycolicibacterium sp. CH28]|uniref:hypothetical protein n=1 Tax=Mycolicibacterium sp. CH28 TaxID=2512237 RepID=UPI0013875ADA|nr:hypothetical protein [Mycolicibacterium sp. CH28]